MNRRSFLSFLGLAPVAAPAAIAAASASTAEGPAKGTMFVMDLRADGASTFTFDGKTLTLPGINYFEALGIQIWHPNLPKGMKYEAAGFGHARIVDADAVLAGRIDSVIERETGSTPVLVEMTARSCPDRAPMGSPWCLLR